MEKLNSVVAKKDDIETMSNFSKATEESVVLQTGYNVFNIRFSTGVFEPSILNKIMELDFSLSQVDLNSTYNGRTKASFNVKKGVV